MFTAKQYEAIAKALRDERSTATTNGHRQMHARITHALADLFAHDNTRFDSDLFYDAAGLPRTRHSKET